MGSAHQDSDIQRLLDLHSLFASLPEEDLKYLHANCVFRNVDKGEVIFDQGSRPLGVYGLLSGKLKVCQHGGEGGEQIVKLLGSNNLFGICSNINNTPYKSAAIAVEKSEVICIARDPFMSVLKSNTELAMVVMKMVAQDVLETEVKLASLVLKPVKKRIAEALLAIAESFGYEQGGNILNASLTRREIGNMAGTTTETAIRMISEFNRLGVIRIHRRKIEICQPKVLQKLATMD